MKLTGGGAIWRRWREKGKSERWPLFNKRLYLGEIDFKRQFVNIFEVMFFSILANNGFQLMVLHFWPQLGGFVAVQVTLENNKLKNWSFKEMIFIDN